MDEIDEMGQPQGIAPKAANKNKDDEEMMEMIKLIPTISEQTDGIYHRNTQHKTVGDIMAAFKSITTVEYIRGVKSLEWKPFKGRLWQRNYWEHIIRNELA